MYRFLSKAFIVPFIIVVILVLISLIGPSLPLIKGLSGFSLTDVGIIFLAVYTILKKPWGESLAVHFKQAYKKQLDDIAKVVKERDALREKCNTSSFLFQAYDSLE
ncbi:hypothetical protein F4X73_02545, partial [Candidatus Poribacteria bacterium]|nr:hypothetical protein [Candidatus Poribacteria bacterium]